MPELQTSIDAAIDDHLDWHAGLATIGRADLERVVGEALRGLPSALDVTEIADVVELLLRSNELMHSGLRVGGWRIEVRRNLLRSALAGGILAAAVAGTGIDSPPVAVLAVVLQFVVDVDRVTIRASDQAVLAALRVALPARGTVAEWYEALPNDVQSQITELHLADVLERLAEAGAIVTDPLGVHELPEAPHGRLVIKPSVRPAE